MVVTVPRGYTWRYVANDLTGSLKLEKIIHKDPLDSDIERGPRMQEPQIKSQDPKIGKNRDSIEENKKEIDKLRGRK